MPAMVKKAPTTGPKNWVDAIRENEKYGQLEMSVPAFALIARKRKDPGAIIKYLAENPDVAKEMVEKTGLGIQNEAHYKRWYDEALRNPAIAHKWTQAHATAHHMLDKIDKEIDAMPETKTRRALEQHNFRAYRDAANEKDLAARQGKSSASGSIKAALQRGDFKAYKELANRRDLAKRRRG
jgi:hypothetical protein